MAAPPRVKATLLGRQQYGRYYQIGAAAKWSIGVAYVVLGVLLAVMFVVCQLEAARMLGPAWL